MRRVDEAILERKGYVSIKIERYQALLLYNRVITRRIKQKDLALSSTEKFKKKSLLYDKNSFPKV